MTKNDGGPAFPETGARGYAAGGEGMSLRDWFAGQAPTVRRRHARGEGEVMGKIELEDWAYPSTSDHDAPGLTKLELIAAMAMQGMLANPNVTVTMEIAMDQGDTLSVESVRRARNLLAELGKSDE